MGFVDNIKKILNPEFYGWTTSSQSVEGNLPVYPEWFFTARIGQPRSINVLEVRNFARSPWVQMVMNTQKREMSIIDWDIVPVDEDDNIDSLQEDIDKCKEYLQMINSDGETIDDLHSMLVTDLGEIDAGTLVNVFSDDSYEEVTEPVYDEQGREIDTTTRLKLKPLGGRTLLETRSADGSTFLKQVDIYRRLIAYYQYSFKNPRTNPKRFEPDEVIYYYMNKKSYTLYGFSPVQSVLQVIETLMQATRWNKDFFKNNAVPDGIISLPNASPEALQNFKRSWENTVKGKPHKLIWQNSDAKFESFMKSARDMEWLEGQKWYFHLVFAAFGVSPVEAGFHENVNQGNQAGQERITVKNAIKPLLTLFENMINKRIIPEILQQEKPRIKFVYKPKEHVEEQIEFEQDTKLIEQGVLTINEYRKSKGWEPVEWGDVPMSIGMLNQQSELRQQEMENQPQQDPQQQREKEAFLKRFGVSEW